jgi:hypothetical protein
VEFGAVLVGEQIEDEGAGAGEVVGFEAGEGEVVGVVVVSGVELVSLFKIGEGGGNVVVGEVIDGALAVGGEGAGGLGGDEGNEEEEEQEERKRKIGEPRVVAAGLPGRSVIGPCSQK